MQHLSSLQNPRIKLARSLATRKGRLTAGLFLIEGPKLLAEALQAGRRPMAVFASPDWWAADATRPPFAGMGGEHYAIAPHLLESIATTETPGPVVALCPFEELSEPAALESDWTVLVLHRLQDPGNVGTAIRAADAAGARLVVVTPESADPYGPKAVRASMGSVFHLPIVRMPLERFAAWPQRPPLLALSLQASESLYEVPLHRGAAFLIGTEGAGLGSEDVALADRSLKIPIPGRAESLNAAMAATVCLYEAARQRLYATRP